MALPQFNVGKSSPWSSNEAIKQLLDRFYDLAQRIGSISASVESLRNSFARLAELSGRLSASMMVLVGLPRVMRSDLHHMMLGGGRHGTSTSGKSSSGSSSSSNFPGWDAVYKDQVANLTKFNQEKLRQDIELHRARMAIFGKEKEMMTDLALAQVLESAGIKTKLSQYTHTETEFVGPDKPFNPTVKWKDRPRPPKGFFERGGEALARRFPITGDNDPVRMLAGRGLQVGLLSVQAIDTVLKSAVPFIAKAIKTVAALPVKSSFMKFATGSEDPKEQKEILNKSWSKLKANIDTVSHTFLGLSAAAGGLLRAASPDLFGTFTMSLQLLAANIGETLIPTFIDWTVHIQEASEYFEGLSSETKELIGSILKWTLITTGAVAAIRALQMAASTLTSKFGLLVAAIGLAIYSFDRMINKRPEQDKMKEERAKKLFGPVTEEELSTIPEVLEAREKFKDDKPGLAAHLKALSKMFQVEAAKENQRRKGMEASVGGVITDLFGNKPEGWEKSIETQVELERKAKALGTYSEAVRQDKSLPATPEMAKMSEGDRAQKLLLHISSMRVSPRFQAVEEAYKNIQIQAIGKDPLETKLEQKVTQHLMKIIEQLAKGTEYEKDVRDRLANEGIGTAQ